MSLGDVTSERFSELGQLFGAYLHQDYDVEHGSIEGAIRDYRDESSTQERGEALRQIDVLLDAFPNDDDLYAALRKLGFTFAPQRDGDTATGWLRRTRALIASPSEPPRPRA